MNSENETEKLILLPEKVIPILLKHLMYLKNENAYLKNKEGLNNSDYSTSLKHMGINDKDDSASLKEMGINDKDNSTTLKDLGINNKNNSTPLKDMGINDKDNSTSLKDTGINEKDNSTTLKDIGINDKDDGTTLKGIGINNIVEALSVLNGTSNTADMLYSVFEQELINALEHYIKKGDGKNTLYYFYSNFMEALADKNSLTDKIKEAEANLQLEDTHILPVQIPVDSNSLSLVEVYFYEHLPINSKPGFRKNVALEVLFLHNNGTAKQTQLRECTGISVSGFSKHLPKLIKYGLIKELPKFNYTLTETSKHNLLRLYGIPKNKL